MVNEKRLTVKYKFFFFIFRLQTNNRKIVGISRLIQKNVKNIQKKVSDEGYKTKFKNI